MPGSILTALLLQLLTGEVSGLLLAHPGNASLPRLFCYVVARAGDRSEMDLLQMHLRGPMLSACDGYTVFSNASFREFAGPDLLSILPEAHFAAAVNGSMESSYQSLSSSVQQAAENSGQTVLADRPGQSLRNSSDSTAQNTYIFRQVWRWLLDAGLWQRYDWVVKVDPDTVFFPQRLRLVLQNREADKAIAVFAANSCNSSMGGIEVLSRKAMEVMRSKWDLLQFANPREDAQLMAFAEGRMHAELLREPNMVGNKLWQDWDWRRSCGRPWKVAYHPLKWPVDMRSCIGQALRAGMDPPLPPGELSSKCTPV